METGRLITAVAVVMSIAACAPTEDPASLDPAPDATAPDGTGSDTTTSTTAPTTTPTTTSTSTSTTGDGTLRDVDVGGIPADVFLPGGAEAGEAAPVVVMLHGTEGERSHMVPLAESVADDGALVYVPTWPVIDQAAPFPEGQGDEPFRAQSEAVVCALRFIRRTAAEHGGDPADLTVVGHSGGGMIGARVSIVDEPPWPGIDCDVGVDHRPTRFIGLAGDYEGVYQYATARRDLYEPYDVLTLEPTNDALEVWLINGHNDDAVNVWTAALFQDHLRDAGIDARLLTTDTTHAAMVDPTTPAGRFTADRISAIVHGRPEASWWPTGSIDATMGFGPGESCTYDGPDTWPLDRAMTFRMANDTESGVSFALVSVRTDADPSIDDIIENGGGILGEDNPDWVDWGGFRDVPPGQVRTMRFAFVEGDQRFVLYCHLQAGNEHPRAGWMYPAAVLDPDDGSTAAPATETAPSTTGVVHLVGDSITAMHGGTFVADLAACGWAVDLHSVSSRRIDRSYEWHDRWVASGVDEIGRILLSDDPDTWLFQLGSNDLQDLHTAADARGLVDEVMAMVDTTDRVLWTTVLWPEYDDAATLLNDALRSTPGIELVDWYAVGGDQLADAVHPTHEGAELLAGLYCDALGRPGPETVSAG